MCTPKVRTSDGHTSLHLALVKRFGVRRAVVIVAIGVIAGCGDAASTASPTPVADTTVIATVGTQKITQAQLDVRMASTTTAITQGGGPTSGPSQAAMLETVRQKAIQSLVVDAVIAQEASFRGVAATDADVNTEIAQDEQAAGGPSQLATQLADVGGSLAQLKDETVSRINEQHLEDYFAKARADQVVALASQGQAFATLARQYSDDPSSAKNGGDLGVVTQAQLDSGDVAFKAAVLALGAGQTSAAPVRDSAGYEILEVVAVTPQGRHVQRILVAAPQPYTIKERPAWFSESVGGAVAQLCDQNSVHVLVDGGAGVCPTTPAMPSGPATASAHP